jgi:hypothetical protein
MTALRIKSALLALIGVGLLLLIVSLPGQRVQGDEAAFGEFAWFQSQDGYVHSELFRGLLEYETRVLLYHKLFIWLGAGMVSLFGFGLWPLRALSILSFAVLGGLLWRHARDEKSTEGAISGLAAVAFLLLSPLTFKFAKFYRPEMMLAALGLCVFLAIERGIRTSRSAFILLGGLAAGTAMLVHLNGAIYVVSGAVLLLAARRWSGFAVFGAAAVLAFSPFGFEMIGRLDLFWRQFSLDPTFVGNERSIIGSLLKLADEHKRLFRGPEIIFSTTTFLVAAAANIRSEGWQRRDFYLFTAVSMITLGGLAPAKTAPYAVLLFPLWALEVGHWIGRLPHSWRAVPAPLRATFALVIAVFVFHSLAADAINAVTDKQDWAASSKFVSEAIPGDVRVLAPLDFVFNELPNRQIAGLRLANWRIEEWGGKPYTLESLTAYADSAGCAAIVLDLTESRRLGLDAESSKRAVNGYMPAFRDPDGNRIVYLKEPPAGSGSGR